MARGKKQRPADEGPPGAPDWVVTFTDMISLLVTFFVLLMTFSSIDARDMLKIDAWLFGATSLARDAEGRTLVEGPEDDLVAATDLMRGSTTPHSRPQEELLDDVEHVGQLATDAHVAVDLARAADGLVVTFSDDEGFAPGSEAVPPALARSLGELGRVLQHYPYLVVVEGFAGGPFEPSPRWATPDELACARAVAAADAMLAASELSPKLVQVAAPASARARADADTPEGRRANRRVEVRILSPSRLRAAHLEAERDALRRGFSEGGEEAR